jgi:hypothetical protein
MAIEKKRSNINLDKTIFLIGQVKLKRTQTAETVKEKKVHFNYYNCD